MNAPAERAAPPPGSEDHAFQALTLLMQLEENARRATDPEGLGYAIVNDTRRLLEYRQAVLFDDAPRPRVVAVSSVAQPDRNAPFMQWLERVADHLAERTAPTRVTPAALPESLARDWSEYGAPETWMQPLKAPDGGLVGRLWLTRDRPWTEGETVLLERLTEAYAHAWQALRQRTAGGRRLRFGRRAGWLAAAVVVGVLLVPVRQSALAPAEVVPRDPLVVASPLAGVVAEVLVEPNQPVFAGQPLVRFVDVELRARAEVAARSLAVAQAELRTARQEAFSDPRSKARLAELERRSELRAAERAYAEELLRRVTLRAERDGVVVFRDPNDWNGRPAAVGERIMLLADPERVELRVDLPVDDAIALEEGAAVRLFPDADPLSPRDALLTHASYEAETTPAGVLAFRLKARFDGGDAPPRLGLRGTAKLHGERVPLFLYLFRRPIAAARQWFGL